MRITKIEVRNFRLLQNVELFLDDVTTVIVGRNNSGKTSLAEMFRRLLSDTSAGFRLEDFSAETHAGFWKAFELSRLGKDEPEVRTALPIIETSLIVEYAKDAASLGPLGDFIVDLDPDCVQARIDIRYEIAPGKLGALFDPVTLDEGETQEQQRASFFRSMKELVPKHYRCAVQATDPNDPSNRKDLEWPKLRALVQGDLIGAHRGLDDTTHKENDSLGKILSVLFATAGTESADEGDQATVAELRDAVQEVQGSIDQSFNDQLTKLLPALDLFGYRLPAPKLRTETQFNVELLLKNHTKIRYSGADGVHLPEAYNGLGARNLIYMLLKLFEAFKSFRARSGTPGVHLVFIEEPEAHLHPQMQEVFVQKLGEMVTHFAKDYGGGTPWPVQFVITTHSPHIANKAEFHSVRYFLASTSPSSTTALTTEVRDLKRDFGDKTMEDNDFLHQYMTQTRCDLLFADKVILIEGTVERLLLPKMIEKVDSVLPSQHKLGSQYVSVLEVGGAHAHIFFKLLDFLKLPSLVITDIDTMNAAGFACKVSEAVGTSNATIRAWFDGAGHSRDDLLSKTDAEKTKGNKRIAYQISENEGEACGRSLEEAFILANAASFTVNAADPETSAMEFAKKEKKSAFALRHAIRVTGWNVPRYISEGLAWLARFDASASTVEAAAASTEVAAVTVDVIIHEEVTLAE